VSSPAGRSARFTAFVGDATRTVEVITLEDGRYQVTVDGTPHLVDSRRIGPVSFSLLIEHATREVSVLARGDTYAVEVGGRTHRLRLLDERALRARQHAGPGEREVRAAMPGKVLTILVEVGATVTQGQGLLVLEAMKMENEVPAPRAGELKELRVQVGQTVEAGELLAVVE
jgi:biotin carboxyl carrier protein